MFQDIFLVTIDSLRPDYLGVYNPDRQLTPIIDELAKAGTFFTQAVSPAPFATPAIASLLTGLYPFRTGVRLTQGQLCDHGVPTLAEYARRAGFRTGGFPSTCTLNSKAGLGRGFDGYDDVTERITSSDGRCWQTGDAINHHVDQFLANAGQQRVFTWVHYSDLHDYHLDTNLPVEQSYARDLTDKIDRLCIGGLLDVLRKHERLKQAAIILTSDHGECLSEHGERGHGGHLYDSVMHVPLIWRWGSRPRAIKRIDRQVRLVDIMPTLLELWGFQQTDWPSPIDGQSLAPLLKCETDPLEACTLAVPPSYAETSPGQISEEDIKGRETFTGPEQQSLRTERYKLILHADGHRELYDLQGDPGELNNLADSKKTLSDQLAKKLTDLVAPEARRHAHRSSHEEKESETLQRLRSLGYVN